MGKSHSDVLVDSDNKCIIDVVTRNITNESGKTILLQYDHNSERIGFTMSRFIDGHDMSESDRVSVYYLNSSSSSYSSYKEGCYIVDDVAVSDDGESITFTWLVGSGATQLVGPTVLSVNFRCFDSDSNVTYNWSTRPCSMYTVVEGLDVADDAEIEVQFNDLLTAFENKMTEYGTNLESSLSSTLKSEADDLESSLETELTSHASTLKTELTSHTSTLKTELTSHASTLKTELTSHASTLKTELTSHASELKTEMKEIVSETEEKIAPILEDYYSYGFVEHMDVLAPASRIEYVGLNENYTAMSLDMSASTTNYGSWSTFPTLVENKPYMVKSTGEADYQLDESDYTLKAEDGSSSDVANTSYDGGAFSKFIKVYVKRWVDGTDRHVRFSFVPIEGYTACGFIDTDGSEMDYVWIPMFYGSTVDGKMRSLSDLQPDKNQTTAQQKTYIDAFSSRAVFFAGPIIETIRDMLYMFFKTTEIQGACGKGNMSGYDSTNTTTYGVLPNAVVSGGQFYGTTDGKSLNKIFHSIVLGSYQQWQRDPYLLCINGRYKVSKDYTYDLTGAKYIDTGIDNDTVDTSKWVYPNLNAVVDGFGSLPISPYGGSTSTGYCDGLYLPANNAITSVLLRFGRCGSGSTGGVGALHADPTASNASWNISASLLLKSPVEA